ncbi:MAG: bifunctional adenosylcobinamide kinase/adenosylcobinamide-phosphate guanylyltransferase [Lachnospiraceae bacterium]|nr:bifunctional adenosylcobinamide kinase/adenosylcobinamide-phosphate guanylyltransferase [Lachnospiraceae bacterium]
MAEKERLSSFHLITGGSGSGKSAYAENCATELSSRRIYIATMIPYGEEGKRRVERHRNLRREKSFETVECYTGLEELDLKPTIQRIEQKQHPVALLECMSNLVANEMFEPNGAGEDAVAVILRGIEALRRQVSHLVVVTNEVFSDGISYDKETMRYLSYLGAVNQAMAAQADTVTEVVYGIPVKMK